ncbi:hypothetical protein D3C78_1803870 [compost metagenome]
MNVPDGIEKSPLLLVKNPKVPGSRESWPGNVIEQYLSLLIVMQLQGDPSHPDRQLAGMLFAAT